MDELDFNEQLALAMAISAVDQRPDYTHLEEIISRVLLTLTPALKFEDVAPDGNCQFTSIAETIVDRASDLDLDVAPDGNCQFTSIAGIYTLRGRSLSKGVLGAPPRRAPGGPLGP